MRIKDWKKATISDNFMFRLVMEKPQHCKTLIERILGIKIRELAYMEAEKSLEAKLASKGVRLDLYVVDEAGVAYDIEMQMSEEYKDFLGRRTRYYVSMMDNDALKKGQPYSELRKSYVIFICTFDPFDENVGLYTFSTICNEAKHIVLDDGVTRVFLNVAGDRHRVSKELVSLMDYINEGKVSDDYTRELEDAVESLREDDGSEALYMTYQQTIMEHEARARKEALAQGLSQGMERMSKLINILMAKGRNKDIALVTSDETARNRLLAEFGI